MRWDGHYGAGVSKVSSLKRTTEVVEHRKGGDPSLARKSPGWTTFEPITLECGLTHDPDFEQWANGVWNYSSDLVDPAALPLDERNAALVELRRDTAGPS